MKFSKNVQPLIPPPIRTLQPDQPNTECDEWPKWERLSRFEAAGQSTDASNNRTAEN